MLSISHESEGYEKGNIFIKDVALTMGMLCAPRLSLKPLIHDSMQVLRGRPLVSYVDTVLCCMLALLAGWCPNSS